MTPPDCDLRGLPFMPLDVNRLLDSDLFALSTGDEFKAALALWARSWGQVPAASIPADERLQARLAGVSVGEWRTLSPRAMQGWQLCSDGRLYHPVVAEKALTAWIERLRHRERSAKGNAARYGHELDTEGLARSGREAFQCLKTLAPALAAQVADLPQGAKSPPSGSEPPRDASPTRSEKTSEGRGRGTIPVGAPSAAPIDPNKEAWQRACALLKSAGKSTDAAARSFFGKLLSQHALEARDLLPSIVKAEGLGTPDPQSYLIRAAKAVGGRRGVTPAAPTCAEWTTDQWATAVRLYRQDGSWSAEWGPPPDQSGCLAPAELLPSKVLRFPTGGAA
jgi:hypothetical protein